MTSKANRPRIGFPRPRRPDLTGFNLPDVGLEDGRTKLLKRYHRFALEIEVCIANCFCRGTLTLAAFHNLGQSCHYFDLETLRKARSLENERSTEYERVSPFFIDVPFIFYTARERDSSVEGRSRSRKSDTMAFLEDSIRVLRRERYETLDAPMVESVGITPLGK